MDRDRDRRYGGPDRDRKRDRDRDRYDEGTTYHTDRPGGESYRPGGVPRARSRTPPRSNNYRRRSRSPQDDWDRYRDRDRRDEYMDRDRDRNRSRSRSRRRSPPRRGYSPRRVREENNYRPARSPRRESRHNRSPRRDRDRTPTSAKRSRDGSPVDRRAARSPLAKRERLPSPRSRYRSPSPKRAYSPRGRFRDNENNYRPRSRTPRRDPGHSERYNHRSPSQRRVSAPDSGATSRRSSPPVHPSRLRQVPESRAGNEDDSPYVSPPQEREKVPTATNGPPPLGPRNATRAPPAGPAGARNFSSPQLSAPTGPASATSRAGPSAVFNAPSRPRGGFGGVRGGHVGYQPSRRTSEFHTVPRAAFASNPPTGPRASGAPPPSAPAAYRSNSAAGHTSSTSYQQRPQRFLNDLPSITPNGRIRPAKPLPNTDKAKKLDLEAERLRRQIEEAEIDKRARLREWERLQGDAEAAKLGTELAAERLRVLEMEDFK